MNDGFFAYLDSIDADDLRLFVTAACSDETGLSLEMRLELASEESCHEKWTIRAMGIRQATIGLGDCDLPWELTQNHALLSPFLTPKCELYFKGRATNPMSLIGDLFVAHRSIGGNWFSFGDSINPCRDIEELLGLDSGLFADCPEPLAEIYAEVLQKHGLQTSMIRRSPSFWNGRYWSKETATRLYALILGETVLVAEEFQFERTSAPVIQEKAYS